MSLTVLLAVAFVGAALYYVCPLRLRWVLLLLLSYGFYLTCGLSALPFIALTTLTTWAGALVISCPLGKNRLSGSGRWNSAFPRFRRAAVPVRVAIRNPASSRRHNFSLAITAPLRK